MSGNKPIGTSKGLHVGRKLMELARKLVAAILFAAWVAEAAIFRYLRAMMTIEADSMPRARVLSKFSAVVLLQRWRAH